MVSFQCEGCGDVFTKKRLDAHASRCRNAGFTCLDCHVSFYGTSYRSHTSCISEAQKYQGHLYQEKKPAKMKQARPPPPPAPAPPRPTVEDFDESRSEPPRSVKSLKMEHLPPAPTPPSAESIPINVFDFLEKNNAGDVEVEEDEEEEEEEQDESMMSDSSRTYDSEDDFSDASVSPEPEAEANPQPNHPPPYQDATSAAQLHQQQQQAYQAQMAAAHGYGYSYTNPYVYGAAFVPAMPAVATVAASNAPRHELIQDASRQLLQTSPRPSHAQPQPQTTTTSTTQQNPVLQPVQTPGPATARVQFRGLKAASESRSDKKRKRSPSGLDVEAASKEQAPLHTGLTGGLSRLLPPDVDMTRDAEGSPLSPKKRSKRNREDPDAGEKVKSKTKSGEDGRKRTDKHNRASEMFGDPSDSTALVMASSKALAATSKEERRRQRRLARARSSIGDMDMDIQPARRAIEYHQHRRVSGRTAASSSGSGRGGAVQHRHQSHSDFFLTLIDKDHNSVKGQSIWGALKMFHEGRRRGRDELESGGDGDDELSRHRLEEKRLLKGLRCKINRDGEIVLFSRPEAERD